MKKSKITDVLVSVCIPTYNGEKYLLECLNSVSSQTFKDFELVVSDDKSTDFSLVIVKEFLVNHPWIKNKIIINKKTGIGNNWNNCIKNASGVYMKFLFQDDNLEPNCLEEMVYILDNNPDVCLVASKRKIIYIGEQGIDKYLEWILTFGDLQKGLYDKKEKYFWMDINLFKEKNFLSHPLNKIGEPSSTMFRLGFIQKIGFFREDLVQILDYEYFLRFLSKGRVCIINQELIQFRLHENQASMINKENNISEEDQFFKILYTKYFWVLNWSIQKQLFVKFNPVGKVFWNLRLIFSKN